MRLVAHKMTGIEKVRANVQKLSFEAKGALKSAIVQTATQVRAGVVSNLSGRVLNPRTGALRSSVYVRYLEADDSVRAQVGMAWYPGGFWERGFNGQQHVRSHLRATKGGQRTEVYRRNRRGQIRRTKVYRTGAAIVSEYDRTVNGAPRPPLQPELDRARVSFRTQAEQAVRGKLG